jgi:hypothetical protein
MQAKTHRCCQSLRLAVALVGRRDLTLACDGTVAAKRLRTYSIFRRKPALSLGHGARRCAQAAGTTSGAAGGHVAEQTSVARRVVIVDRARRTPLLASTRRRLRSAICRFTTADCSQASAALTSAKLRPRAATSDASGRPALHCAVDDPPEPPQSATDKIPFLEDPRQVAGGSVSGLRPYQINRSHSEGSALRFSTRALPVRRRTRCRAWEPTT